MASAKIVLGGEIDVCTSDEMKDGLDAFGRDLKGSMAKPKRILRPLTRSVTGLALSAGGTAVVVLGRPDSGRVWVITNINVMGDDDTSPKTGLTGALYIGDPANVGIGQCVQFGQAIPWSGQQNEHAYVVHDREDAFIYLTASGAVTGQVVVTATAWEYRDVDIESQHI